MKITLLGAAGVRTPLIVRAMAERQQSLGLTELALMDIDGSRLELIRQLTLTSLPGRLQKHTEKEEGNGLRIVHTTDAAQALDGADFVITTFRVGGTTGRVIDERVALAQNVLGQETTGPGGFAMGLRSIPVLLSYLRLMEQHCPNAWLVNFANPAGMLAEAAIRLGGWQRTVGICDAPQGMQRLAAAILGAPVEEVYLDYFGLNHLGWVSGVNWQGNDYLPDLIAMLRGAGGSSFLPFEVEFIAALGMIPNEYLYYYYHTQQAVQHILQTGKTRGEQILALNETLFAELERLKDQPEAMQSAYAAYLHQRSSTYMTREIGQKPKIRSRPTRRATPAAPPANANNLPGSLAIAFEAVASSQGYAEVAMDLIEALIGKQPRRMILNIPNQGVLPGLQESDVIETPAYVGRDLVQPLITTLPASAQMAHCLGLVQQVKAYERLTIEAAAEGSYRKASLALALHPLVPSPATARSILDGYIAKHGQYFPQLT